MDKIGKMIRNTDLRSLLLAKMGKNSVNYGMAGV